MSHDLVPPGWWTSRQMNMVLSTNLVILDYIVANCKHVSTLSMQKACYGSQIRKQFTPAVLARNHPFHILTIRINFVFAFTHAAQSPARAGTGKCQPQQEISGNKTSYIA